MKEEDAQLFVPPQTVLKEERELHVPPLGVFKDSVIEYEMKEDVERIADGKPRGRVGGCGGIIIMGPNKLREIGA